MTIRCASLSDRASGARVRNDAHLTHLFSPKECLGNRGAGARPLPRPLAVPTVMELSTLADVRGLVEKHLPEQYRRKPAWRHVSTEIAKAAEGEKDLLEVCVSLRLVLALEGVECLAN
jgi:hypothetical protein